MPRLTAAEGVVYVRRLVGDDRPPERLDDDLIMSTITQHGGNLDLAAADLRDLIESRTGDDLGAAWGRRTDYLRQKGLASIDAGGNQSAAHRAGGS